MAKSNKSILTAQLLNEWHDQPFRLGILGGSFDPPHYGHLGVSQYMLKEFNLDYIIWVVALQNPLKQKASCDFSSRVELARQYLENESLIMVSDIEQHLSQDHKDTIYSYELIGYLSCILPQASLHFIIGADNLLSLHKWKESSRLTDKAQILVYDRKQYSAAAMDAPILSSIHGSLDGLDRNAPLVFCRGAMYDVSSTEIRQLDKEE